MPIKKAIDVERDNGKYEFALARFEKLGYIVNTIRPHEINFIHNGSEIKYYPATTWFFGNKLKNGKGKGMSNLIKQLTGVKDQQDIGAVNISSIINNDAE